MSDYAAAQRVDQYIANSRWTQERISTYYQRPSTVVYPPIDTTYFTPAPGSSNTRDYFLCVGRLTPSKHFEQAIAVCEKLGLRLVIVGTGHDKRRLRRLSKGNTYFAGKVSKKELREYYRNAKAIIQPGEEDFGMASAEALACGTPVIAYGIGGVTEIVRHHETGILYQQPTVEALAEALRTFLSQPRAFAVGPLQESVLRFSVARFRQGIIREISALITPDE